MYGAATNGNCDIHNQARERPLGQTFGENACHPEPIRFAQGKLREGSGSPDTEILRCAQDDSQDTAQVMSP